MKHIKEYKRFLLEQETYTDYPAAASKNAQQALDWRDEHGRDEVDAGLRVGWMRANQLANKEAISADTVKRMSAFNRHRKNSKISADLKDTPWKDRGYVAWLLWGGDAGVDWAMKKSKEIDKANESIVEGKVKPTDDTIRFHIDAYRVDDDPYEVAQEIGKEYGWTEREIQKAEKLIRKKYLR